MTEGSYYDTTEDEQCAMAIAELIWRDASKLIGTHRYRLKTYRDVIVGEALVRWMLNDVKIHEFEEDAVATCEGLVRRGLLQPAHTLTRRTRFENAFRFYRLSNLLAVAEDESGGEESSDGTLGDAADEDEGDHNAANPEEGVDSDTAVANVDVSADGSESTAVDGAE